MHHLPAYLALQRLVGGRRVAIVMPDGPVGPRALLAAGARQVLVIGGEIEHEPGIEVGPGGPDLPLRDGSVDMVVCIEAFGSLPAAERRVLLREAHRVLVSRGLLVAWVEQQDSDAFGHRLPGSKNVDFWALEDDLAAQFDHVDLLAQMPWQGFSVAPIFDDGDPRGDRDPALSLREGLLGSVPEASHYIALAYKSYDDRPLDSECLLIPIPADQAFGEAGEAARASQVEAMSEELDRLREDLSLRAAKAAAAHGRVRELEDQLREARLRADERASTEFSDLRDRIGELEAQLSAARAREEERELEVELLQRERRELESRVEEVQEHQDSDHERLESDRKTIERLQSALEEAEEALTRADQERERQQSKVRSQETDLGILTRTTEEREVAFGRVCEELEESRRSKESTRRELEVLTDKLEQLDAERDELRRQVDVLLAEREGARKLAARVEAELEVAKRKLEELEDQLAAKIEEASRVAGEMEGLRQRAGEQERRLTQFQSRAEELSASAASGAEKGRMLADVALDRDRLREELGERARQNEELERKLWETREALQAERIENVRAAGEQERLRERLERARAAEQERTQEVTTLANQLRDSELERAELGALVKARDERISQMLGEAELLADESADATALRMELDGRGSELARLTDELEQSRARARQSGDLAQKRERELRDAGESIRRLQKTLDDQASLAGELQGELDVKQLEVEQLAATVANQQEQLEHGRQVLRDANESRGELQRRFEEAAAGRQELRRQLRVREQELEQFVSKRETNSLELFKLRRELDAAVRVNEELEHALEATGRPDDFNESEESGSWPADAQVEVQHLRERLAAEAKRHGQELAGYEQLVGNATTGEQDRLRRLQLEAGIRAAEQEHMLSQLDGAEQKIWEMTDAADRNAARFAASLAQLEKQREKVDQILDELEVTRNLLGAEQARALEQERLLASERAKLARAGLGIEGFPRSSSGEEGEVDRVFSDLNAGGGKRVHGGLTALGPDGVPGAITDGSSEPHRLEAVVDDDDPYALDVDLARLAGGDLPSPSAPEPGSPTEAIEDRTGSAGSGAWRDELSGAIRRAAERAPAKARLVVEAVDDDEWPEDDDELEEHSGAKSDPKGDSA